MQSTAALPAELRTPPLPLMALVGHPELQRDFGIWATQVLRPPLISVAVAEANEALLSRVFGAQKPLKPIATPEGILKADWFLKQRQRRAAVAVVFVERSEVEGDPTSWMRMAARVKAVRDATAHRGAGVVVAILQDGDGAAAPLPQDRVAALCNLGLEPKALYPLARGALTASDRAQLEQGLAPLGRLLLEAAGNYYSMQAARIRQRAADAAAALGSCPPEIAVAAAFKMAVMSEFRQDWVGAVGQYRAAYAALKGVPLGQPQPSVQRHAEITAVAEIIHFKAMMLLLHQQRPAEALAQFRDHVATYGPLHPTFPPAAAAAHLGWLSRQYRTAAEMAAGRVDDATLRALPDCAPRLLQATAAQLAVRRKAAAAAAAAEAAARGPGGLDVDAVRPGDYLGQMVLRVEGGSRDLSDAEFCEWLASEETAAPHDQEVLEALGACLSATAGAGQERGRAQFAVLAAAQHAELLNPAAARRLLLQAAHTYRRDGWPLLLGGALSALRDCCQRLKLPREALLYSLELACLAGGPVPRHQAEGIASAALAGVLAGGGDHKTSILKAGQQREGQDEGPQQQQQQQQQQQGGGFRYTVQHMDMAQAQRVVASPREDGSKPNMADVLLQHTQQDNAWLSCLTVSAGFQAAPAAPSELRFCCAVWSHVPVALPLAGVSLQLRDDAGPFTVQALDGPPPPPPPQQQQKQTAGQGSGGGGGAELTQAFGSLRLSDQPTQQQQQQQQQQQHQQHQQEDGAAAAPLGNTSLAPGQWRRFHFRFDPRGIGPVAAEQLQLDLGPHASVTFALSSFPPRQPALGGAAWPGGAAPFGVAAGVRLGVFGAQVAHVGPLPTLQLSPVHSVHLVGEATPVDITIAVARALPAAALDLSAQVPLAADAPPDGPPSAAAAAAAGGATDPRQQEQPIVVLLAERDGKLAKLEADAASLRIPAIPAAGRLTLRVWLRASAPVGVRLSATLLCPAAVPAAAALRFRRPFEGATRLFAETGVHSLVAPTPAYEAAAAAATATSGGGGQGGEVSGSLASAPAVPLVIGQASMAQVLVRAAEDVPLSLLDVSLEANPASGLQLVNQLGDQLPVRPAPTGLGSGHVFVLHLLATRFVPPPGGPVGRLLLTWRRDGGGGGAEAPAGGGGAPPSAAAAPPPEVVTALELPRVAVVESTLSARVVAPPSVTAGLAFPFQLQLNNFSRQPQEAALVVQDAQGFVFSGDKAQTVQLAPRSEARVGWQLVAHAAGELPLPAVRVSLRQLGASVLTQSCLIHVLPF